MRRPFQLKIPNEVRDILETELKSIPEAEMKGHLWPSDVPQKHSKIYSQSKEMGGVHISSCIFSRHLQSHPHFLRRNDLRGRGLSGCHRVTDQQLTKLLVADAHAVYEALVLWVSKGRESSQMLLERLQPVTLTSLLMPARSRLTWFSTHLTDFWIGQSYNTDSIHLGIS